MHWTLDAENKLVREPDVMAWARWFEAANNREGETFRRSVARDELDGVWMVSTVFLGIDHRFGDDGPALVFETMIFWPDDPLNNWCERWATWGEAEAGHREIVARLRADDRAWFDER